MGLYPTINPCGAFFPCKVLLSITEDQFGFSLFTAPLPPKNLSVCFFNKPLHFQSKVLTYFLLFSHGLSSAYFYRVWGEQEMHVPVLL